MLAIKAIVKDGLIKPLEAIDLPEDKKIVIYNSEEKVEEGKSSFFFPSAFDFWNGVPYNWNIKRIGEVK